MLYGTLVVVVSGEVMLKDSGRRRPLLEKEKWNLLLV